MRSAVLALAGQGGAPTAASKCSRQTRNPFIAKGLARLPMHTRLRTVITYRRLFANQSNLILLSGGLRRDVCWLRWRKLWLSSAAVQPGYLHPYNRYQSVPVH